MRADELRGLGRLGGMALGGGVQRVAQAHAGIAQRVFSSVRLGVGPAVTPVQVVHDGISRLVYGTVQSALVGGARAAGAVAAACGSDGPRLADRPRAGVALGVLNGAHGDLLAERAAGLALPMTLRWRGADLEPEREALRGAYPAATDRLVVFVHGLVETEDAWGFSAERHHGDRGVTYGALLERDLGYTPVWVRYNTGLHVSSNGRSLDELLDRLVAAWPQPVGDLVLIGHSMGGLVVRSALARAGDGAPAGQRRWPGLVRDTVTLGTPHLGAPLEQGVHRLSTALRRLDETRWLADQLDARSAGIKDLRHGALVDADWGLDPRTATRTHVPLHPAARHFVVLATLAGRHDSRAGRALGDLLVRPHSAVGDSRDEHALPFPDDAVCRLGGLHHFDLLNHPHVYAVIRRWLGNRPGNVNAAEAGSAAG